MKELELYVHIPFCMRKCDYCDFLSAAADEKSQYAYMESLNKEIAFYGRAFSDRELCTIYVGGGTPSWVQEIYIRQLFEQIYRSFSVSRHAEISIECNPGTLGRTKLQTYKDIGINRLSMGLQSANDEELKLLGRVHNYSQFLKNYEMARELGFDNINVDLMYALPGQTTKKFMQTLCAVTDLKPKHLSCYSLIIEEGTPFYDRYKFDAVKQQAGMKTEWLPTEEVLCEIGKETDQFLAGRGYLKYEISNYSKKGYECRHNIGYWQRKEYLGVGLGAASLLEEIRYSNVRDLDEYIKRAHNIEEILLEDEVSEKQIGGINLHESAMEVSKNARMEEFMFLGLRMSEGVEKNRFYQNFGLPMHHVYGNVMEKLVKEGLAIEDTTRFYLTSRGQDVSNYALSFFLL